jgi:calcineurin-like phosphoesterase family protein
MTTYFSSDQHYGHANVIKYCNRPFADVQTMDDELIYRHNNIVKHGDTIYMLGDFTFKDPHPYLRRLNGTIILIPGNHDNLNKWVHSSSKPVHIAPPLLEVSVNGQAITMCHYALRTWNSSHYGSWALHGHSHGSLPEDPNSRICDVGVDSWDYAPVSFDQLKEYMSKKTFIPIDHHKAP